MTEIAAVGADGGAPALIVGGSMLVVEPVLGIAGRVRATTEFNCRVMAKRCLAIYRDVLEDRISELAALRNSPSYRIGQAVVKPLRPFRPAIRRVWRFARRRK